MSSRVSRVGVDVVLGPAGRVRAGSVSALLCLGLHLALMVLMLVQAALGLVDAGGARALALLQLAGALGFYAVLRAGLGPRAGADPALPLPQLAFGLLVAGGVQALGGPVSSVGLGLALLILGFALFLLPPPQTRALAVFAFLVHAVATALLAWRAREGGWPVPLLELAFAGLLLLLGVAVLSLRAEVLRQRLAAQRAEVLKLRDALEQAQERIRLLGSDDALTGLANRRHMLAMLQAERARHLRSRQPLALVMLELDTFGRVNEAYGSAAGDTVLKRFAQAGRATLRASDVMGRWGGETFVLMLPETTPESAVACVERLRVALGRMRFDDVAPRLPITFSAGIAVCGGLASIDDTVAAAEAVLRQAALQGGNQTEIAQPVSTAPA